MPSPLSKRSPERLESHRSVSKIPAPLDKFKIEADPTLAQTLNEEVLYQPIEEASGIVILSKMFELKKSFLIDHVDKQISEEAEVVICENKDDTIFSFKPRYFASSK